MTEAIQEATLIEAILSIRSQVDFLWQFFVTGAHRHLRPALHL